MTLSDANSRKLSTEGEWARDLTLDLEVVTQWNPDVVIRLIEEHEYHLLGIWMATATNVASFRSYKTCRVVIDPGLGRMSTAYGARSSFARDCRFSL